MRTAIAFLLVLFAATAASGRALCIEIDPTDRDVFMAPKFRVPRDGKCADWTGVALGETSNVQKGTACRSDDGTLLRITIRTTFLDERIYQDHFEFDMVDNVLPQSFPGTSNLTRSIMGGPDVGTQQNLVARGLPATSCDDDVPG